MKKIIPILLFNFLFAQDIAFVGNSITHGGYYHYVDSLLADSMQIDYEILRYSIPGIAVAVPGNQYKNTDIFQDVINRKPEFTVVMLGTNDSGLYSSEPPVWGDYWEDEYLNLINNFMKNGKVFLGTITYQTNSSGANIPIASMNERIRKIGTDYGMEIIDFNSALEINPSYFQSDGIHPNDEGKKVLAEAAYNVLKRHLSTLSIDDEYWDAVEDYEGQKKIGWFGCQMGQD